MEYYKKHHVNNINNNYVTENQVRDRLLRERENDILLEKLRQQDKAEQIVRMYNEMENKADKKHRKNEIAQCTAEIIMSNNIKQNKINERQRQLRIQQDEQLAAELARRNADEEQNRREIQRICEEDDELRELQEKLKVFLFYLDSICY